MSKTETTEVEYVHEYEYRTRDEKGKWSEPEIRYSNPTESLEWAIRRHEECEDAEYVWDRKFEGIYGHSWKNCRLVKRTKTVTVEMERIS